MKAILVEGKVQIPEEFQLKLKALLELDVQLYSEMGKTSLGDYAVQGTAYKELKVNLYKEIVRRVGMLYSDYPIWGVSESGEELIGYRYEFQEEGA